MNQIKSKKKNARTAGLFYLLMGITGMLGIMYVPSQIIVEGDAATTVGNIVNSELFFRFGIVFNLACQTLFVFLVLSLYNLFKDVDKKQALLMRSLVLVSVPIAFIAALNQIAALVVATGDAFTPEQQQAQTMFFLDMFHHGNSIAEIFWGLWLFPFGVLCYKADFIPKIFGILLMIACVGYLASSFTTLLFPRYIDYVFPFTSVSGMVGEFSILFYLLIKGVRTNRQPVETVGA